MSKICHEFSALVLRRNHWMSLSVLALAACGGGQDDSTVVDANQPAATFETTVALETTDVVAQPNFHRLAIEAEPTASDEDGSGTSAYTAPTQFSVPASLANLPTARQTDADVANARATALAAALPVTSTSYTPAQIRSAYGVPAIPTGTLTAEQAAALGAGQTIYIIDAFDNPNAASDLALFNAKFGLPTCQTVAIPATATLPLAPAPKTGCTFSTVYASTSGMSAARPAYNVTWAGEIALDVQWAHAQAPLARIVLIEARDAGIANLTWAVALANAMGSGVVSMSFGAAEASYVTGYNAVFTKPGMTYVASAGDAGYAVNWPAVAPNVLSVGGTSLMVKGGVRTETTWKFSGGGVSRQVPLPTYQMAVSMYGTNQKSTGRGVNDVSFVADPNTGMFVVSTVPGGTPSWRIYGGTSAGSPQWAGMIAVVNAQRARVGKSSVGIPHDNLYTKIAAVPGNYISSFYDVNTGVNGTQAAGIARVGYDVPTGLGTPNFGNLAALLKGY
jgi:subtilase family serine protease